jgi:hypothetical protein
MFRRRGAAAVPVPGRVYVIGNGNGHSHPDVATSCDASRGGEAHEGLAEALIADTQGPAQSVAGEALLTGTVYSGEDGVGDVVGSRWGGVAAERLTRDDGQVHVALGADESDGDGLV